MTSTRHWIFSAAVSHLASLTLGCAARRAPANDDVRKLIELSKASNVALVRGDGEGYASMVNHAEDFTLMSPFGGEPKNGAPSPERMREAGNFFKNGSLEQEVVHAYGSPEMVVLVLIERVHVEVGGLPSQDWALRVTLVYRREGADWRLAHRHADPLVHAITLTQAAALGRGDTRESLTPPLSRP